MEKEQNRRRRRIPLTQEEVEGVLEFKKRRERMRLLKLKSSWQYKAQNTFNIICFFIFCELVLCYLGPCNYQVHYSQSVSALHGEEFKGDGTPIVAEIDITCLHDQTYKFIVNEYIGLPEKFTSFCVGKDFLLGKDIKGTLGSSEATYRIFSASPILFLSVFTSVIMLIGISYNLNENEYSLSGLTMISGMTLLCVIFM